MKKKKITSGKIDIKHLSILANIPISEKEEKSLKGELEKTISYIDILSQLDTKKIPPIFQTTNLKNVTRQDKSERFLSTEEALKNAPKTKKSYFVTKKVKWE